MTKKYEKTQVTGPSLLNSNGVIAGPSPGGLSSRAASQDIVQQQPPDCCRGNSGWAELRVGKRQANEPNGNENKNPGAATTYLTGLSFVDQKLNDLRGECLFVRKLKGGGFRA